MKLTIPLVVSCVVLLGHSCDSTLQQNPSVMPPQASKPAPLIQSTQKESAVVQSVTGKRIWSGTSGGLGIEWTKDDLFVQLVSGHARTWTRLAKKGFDEFAADVTRTNKAERETTNDCDYRRDFQVLSIVGALVSFQDDEYSDCGGAHPTTYRRFTAIDLARPGEILYGHSEEAMDADLTIPGKVVKLTDYFNEQDILRALLADHIIHKALIDAGVSAAPKSLEGLAESFAKDDYVLSGTELELRPDFLSRFAFHHIEGNKVAVRLNLPSSAFAYRSQQIGMLLPIPPALKQPLTLAATQREGFLMREASRANRNQSTRFDLKIGEGAKHGD